MRVDRQVAGLHTAGHADTAAKIARPDRAGESVLGVVGHADRIGLIVEGDDDDDRSEDLLAVGAVTLGAGEDGGREPVALAGGCGALEGDRCTVGHVGRHGLQLALGDERAHLGARVIRVAADEVLDGRLQQFHETVVGLALDQDARACTAVLTSIVEDAPGCTGRGLLKVGVSEHDVGALAAEFEGDGLDVLGAALHDSLAHRRGAGEDHLAHELVIDEALADHRSLAGQNLQHAFGNAGLKCKLAKTDGGERSDLGGLEHHGAAGRKRRRESPAGDWHREVPRHDDADDTDRLLERHVDATGHRNLATEEALGGAAVVLQNIGDVVDLPPGIADGVAGVDDLQKCELILVRTHDVGEAAQKVRSVSGRHLAP